MKQPKARTDGPPPVNGAFKAVLEFGPIICFLVAYFWLRGDSFTVAGTSYSGFVAVTAVFVPVFVIASVLLWYLTGQIARIQIATLVVLVIAALLGVWFNDPRIIKMKPTVIYLALALVLGVGLMRGQSWLRFVMEDMVPLRPQGWMILTRRVFVVFLGAALANEVVWRTQAEATWVIFEAVVMPLVIIGFFLSQIGLFVEHAAWPAPRKAAIQKPKANSPRPNKPKPEKSHPENRR